MTERKDVVSEVSVYDASNESSAFSFAVGWSDIRAVGEELEAAIRATLRAKGPPGFRDMIPLSCRPLPFMPGLLIRVLPQTNAAGVGVYGIWHEGNWFSLDGTGGSIQKLCEQIEPHVDSEASAVAAVVFRGMFSRSRGAPLRVIVSPADLNMRVPDAADTSSAAMEARKQHAELLDRLWPPRVGRPTGETAYIIEALVQRGDVLYEVVFSIEDLRTAKVLSEKVLATGLKIDPDLDRHVPEGFGESVSANVASDMQLLAPKWKRLPGKWRAAIGIIRWIVERLLPIIVLFPLLLLIGAVGSRVASLLFFPGALVGRRPEWLTKHASRSLEKKQRGRIMLFAWFVAIGAIMMLAPVPWAAVAAAVVIAAVLHGCLEFTSNEARRQRVAKALEADEGLLHRLHDATTEFVLVCLGFFVLLPLMVFRANVLLGVLAPDVAPNLRASITFVIETFFYRMPLVDLARLFRLVGPEPELVSQTTKYVQTIIAYGGTAIFASTFVTWLKTRRNLRKDAMEKLEREPSAIIAIGKRALPALRSLVKNADTPPQRRAAAIFAATLIGDTTLMPHLRRLRLTDRSDDVRRAAGLSAALLGEPDMLADLPPGESLGAMYLHVDASLDLGRVVSAVLRQSPAVEAQEHLRRFIAIPNADLNLKWRVVETLASHGLYSLNDVMNWATIFAEPRAMEALTRRERELGGMLLWTNFSFVYDGLLDAILAGDPIRSQRVARLVFAWLDQRLRWGGRDGTLIVVPVALERAIKRRWPRGDAEFEGLSLIEKMRFLRGMTRAALTMINLSNYGTALSVLASRLSFDDIRPIPPVFS